MIHYESAQGMSGPLTTEIKLSQRCYELYDLKRHPIRCLIADGTNQQAIPIGGGLYGDVALNHPRQ
jgi:hypothetical protein